MPPLVTIAFPVYNGERYLRSAIERALAQTHPATEVVVVDDASTDGSVELARSFGERVRVVAHATNAGIGGNWNRCIEESRGELLAIAHQDDLMAPDFIARAVAALDAAPSAGFVHTNIEQIDEDGRVFARPRRGHAGAEWAPGHDRDFVEDGRRYFEVLMSGPPLICCPTVVMRREVYERVGRYSTELKYSVDTDLYLRVLLAFDVAYLAAPLVQYRRHDEQQTARLKKQARYAERIATKVAGVGLAEKSGRFDAAALARLRAFAARDCCEGARKFALGDPEAAARWLASARALRPWALWSEDGLSARLRVRWARWFGTTAAGRGRAESHAR